MRIGLKACFLAAIIIPGILMRTNEAAAACAPNNNNPQCASFVVIANEEHTIVDVRQKRASSSLYLYRVCASYGSFDIRGVETALTLGPGDCVDLDVSGGQTIKVIGRGDIASGEYLLLHASD